MMLRIATAGSSLHFKHSEGLRHVSWAIKLYINLEKQE